MSLIKLAGRRGAVALLAGAVGLALALTGCSGSPTVNTTPTGIIVDTASHEPTTVTVWSFVTLPNEVKSMQDSMDRLQKTYPWLNVQLVNNKMDEDFTQAVTAGTAPDVFISWDPGSVAQFCTNGSVIDMSAMVKASNLDVTAMFPSSSLNYTQYQGKQCALPLLVDAYGLYYNTDMFTKAGITAPPKTLSELFTDVQKLTIKDAKGNITQWGMTPPRSDFDVQSQWFTGGGTGAQFYDSNMQTTFGTDPTWQELLNWQKQVLDFFGKANVDKFVATYQDSTDGPGSPFYEGVTAMDMNGEWHIGELDGVPGDSENPATKVNWDIAPVPVPDSHANVYGAGAVMGNVIYVSSQSKVQDAAYFVAQQLATDTAFVTDFATQMSNVPTTFDALKSWTAPNTQPKWKTMMDIVSNPNSYNKANTPAGSEDGDAWGTFIQNWEQGKVPDLQAGLSQLDQTITQLNAEAAP